MRISDSNDIAALAVSESSLLNYINIYISLSTNIAADVSIEEDSTMLIVDIVTLISKQMVFSVTRRVMCFLDDVIRNVRKI